MQCTTLRGRWIYTSMHRLHTTFYSYSTRTTLADQTNRKKGSTEMPCEPLPRWPDARVGCGQAQTCKGMLQERGRNVGTRGKVCNQNPSSLTRPSARGAPPTFSPEENSRQEAPSVEPPVQRSHVDHYDTGPPSGPGYIPESRRSSPFPPSIPILLAAEPPSRLLFAPQWQAG